MAVRRRVSKSSWINQQKEINIELSTDGKMILRFYITIKRRKKCQGSISRTGALRNGLLGCRDDGRCNNANFNYRPSSFPSPRHRVVVPRQLTWIRGKPRQRRRSSASAIKAAKDPVSLSTSTNASCSRRIRECNRHRLRYSDNIEEYPSQSFWSTIIFSSPV